jgi:hypothetical protein
MIARTAKPKRRRDTVDAVRVRMFNNIFWDMWHRASSGLLLAWKAYANTQKVLNRNSQYVTLSPQKCAYAYHFRVFDWLNRDVSAITLNLLNPPNTGTPLPQPVTPSNAFSTTEYILHAEHSLGYDPKCIVYAARGRFQAWTTIKSWRFIGAYSHTTGDYDLYSMFQALTPPWELLAGERVFVRFYWEYNVAPVVPNFRTYLSGLVS